MGYLRKKSFLIFLDANAPTETGSQYTPTRTSESTVRFRSTLR